MAATPMMALRHELLQEAADCAKDVALGHGIDGEVAEQIGCAIADMLAKSWGGQTLSFPKDLAFDLSKRDLDIFNDWLNGKPVPVLAKEYNLAVQWIYSIIKRSKKAMIDERQGSLDFRGEGGD